MIWAWILAILVSGCASIPDFELAQKSDPISLETTCFSIDNGLFEEGGWPSSNWWEIFQDEQLTNLILQGFTHSPTLQKALAALEQSCAFALQKRAKLFPEVSLNYQEQWQHFSKNGFIRAIVPNAKNMPPSDNQIDLTANFSWEIDFFGKNKNIFAAALGLSCAQAAEAAQSKMLLAVAITQTYFDIQTLLEQKDILEERVTIARQFAHLQLQRQTVGIDLIATLWDAEQNLKLLQEDLIALEKDLSIALHALHVLIGVGPDENFLEVRPSAHFQTVFPLPRNLAIDLLARRPDVVASGWRIEAAAKQIGAAKADFYPRVNLMALAGLESLKFNNFFTWSSRMGVLEPAIYLPIFTAGRLKASLREKTAAFNEAVYDYNNLLLHAAAEVADQIVSLKATKETLCKQKRVLELANKHYQLYQNRSQIGLDNALMVLQQEDKLLIQAYQLANLQQNHLLSVVNLLKALGGGYREYE